jgi:arylsulfatase A-like enzyme
MANRPAIVIFNPDQWRGDVLGHMGNPAAVTPNIDRLVETDAVSFRNAFCQNPVCTPSRCSFMTGWYPHVHGHRTMHHMLHDHRGQPNLLKILRENGYFVWWGGKNDLVPAQFGYDKHCDIKYSPPEAIKKKFAPGTHSLTDRRGAPDSDTYYSFYLGELKPRPGEDVYMDGDWANVFGAAQFIRSYKGEKPLCIYLPLGYPHPPYAVEEPWYSMIDRSRMPDRIPAPETWHAKPALLKGIWGNQRMQTWTEERWTELRATYYGMCARTDHQLGLVVEALKEAGLYDDTALFMFSDHGDFTGDYGLVEKAQNTFEDCLSRVPFVIKPPKGVALKPRVSDALVELVDFSATVYDLCNIDPGYTHFGTSLLPVIEGGREEHRDAVFCEGGRLRGEVQAMEKESTSDENPQGWYWPRVSLQSIDDPPYHTKAAMCRTKRYKYVRRLYEKDELYDMARDPQEMCNLAEDDAYGGILSQLKERMLRWYMETCDVVPKDTDRRW